MTEKGIQVGCMKRRLYTGITFVLFLFTFLFASPLRTEAVEAKAGTRENAIQADSDYQWKKIDGVWYLLNPKGKRVTGWVRKKKGLYYFRKSGSMAQGWIQDQKRWYYMDSKGVMQTGWIRDGKTWYYLTDEGVMKTGWLKDKKKNKYYLDKSGAMQTGWVRIDKKWYYFQNSGVMSTGWTQIDGEWYLLDESGVMKTGWVKENGKKYFLSASGVMAHNGWLVKKGHWYHFNSGGVLDQDTTEEQSLVSMPGYYISPMKAGKYNSSKERIEAMISRAYEYLNAGTTYRICKSMKPGEYADCSGLVMQCLYAAGFDPSPATPKHHALPENEYDSRTLYHKVPMKRVSYVNKRRGDLIFYNKPGTNTIIHVAIYLGNNRVIESWPPGVTDRYGIASSPHTSVYAVLRPFE